jgi:putative transposase
MNRAVRRARLFDHAGDYQAFMRVLAMTADRLPVQLYSYCVMPNHFHLVCAPSQDGQLSEFMRLLTLTHSKRWHAARGTAGTGCVYQGRFKAFPVQTDSHFLTVCRYVERNPLGGRLVARAEDWQWSSLHARWKNSEAIPLTDWPVSRPANWIALVNETGRGLDAVRVAVRRSRPFGDDDWIETAAKKHELTQSLGGTGRPRDRIPGVVLTEVSERLPES